MHKIKLRCAAEILIPQLPNYILRHSGTRRTAKCNILVLWIN